MVLRLLVRLITRSLAPKTSEPAQTPASSSAPQGAGSAAGPAGSAAAPAGSGAGTFTVWTTQNLVVIAIGVSLAVDYSLVFVSIPAYWGVVAPDALGQMGLIIGLYDLAQFLCAPLFGWLADARGLKAAFLIALCINIVGNVLYSLGIVAGGYHGPSSANGVPTFGTPALLGVGRFVAGIGSGALALSAVYFTVTTSVADRLRASAAQMVPLTLARTLGPALGCFLIAITPQHLSHTDPLQQTFNFLTEAGWLCAGLAVLVLGGAAACFREPVGAGGERLMGAGAASAWPSADPTTWAALRDLAPLLAFYFVNVTARMAMLGAYTYLAVAQFKLVDAAGDLWRPWMGVVGGSLLGVRLMRRLVAAGVLDWRAVAFAQLPFTVGAMLLLQWRASDSYTAGTGDWLTFYFGTGLLNVSNVVFMPNMSALFSRQVSRLAAAGRGAKAQGFITACYTATGALGRFVGPLIGVYVLRPVLSPDVGAYLSACSQNLTAFANLNRASEATAASAWAKTCQLDFATALGQGGSGYLDGLPNKDCAVVDATGAVADVACKPIAGLCLPLFFPQQYYTGGCSLPNTNWFLPVLICLVLGTSSVTALHADRGGAGVEGEAHQYQERTTETGMQTATGAGVHAPRNPEPASTTASTDGFDAL
eukprot:g3419.t1